MTALASDRQNQALAILAIATAAIGFGLFGADWNLQLPDYTGIGVTLAAQIAGAVLALIYYFAVLWTTAKILEREDKIAGAELVRGPVFYMAVEMMSLAGLFVFRVLS